MSDTLNAIYKISVINIKTQEIILPICINLLLFDCPKYFLSLVDLFIMSKLKVPSIWQNSGRTSRNKYNPNGNFYIP